MATESNNWVFGFHAVEEVLNSRSRQISVLYLQKKRQDARIRNIQQMASDQSITVEFVDRRFLDTTVSGKHQGIAARYESSEADPESTASSSGLTEQELGEWLASLQQPFILVLDEITDPHNLGACLRSADAAGVDAVIIPKNNSAPLNATVRKVASGAAETVKLVPVTNLARTLRQLKEQGVWLVGTDDTAEISLFEQDLTGPLALIMGSEGSGLRRLTREICDFLVSIPMHGALSSLNVSVATGVCLFEAVRQRKSA